MGVEFNLDFDKVIASVTFLAASNLPDLSKGKICKLLFLADRAHTVRFGRPVTGDRLCALEHGPILSVTLSMFDAIEADNLSDQRARKLAGCLSIDRRFTRPHYEAGGPVEIDALSKSDMAVLEEVVALYGKKTFKELRTLSHEFQAYKRAWDSRGSKNAAEMRFEDLFGDEDTDDIVIGAEEEMLENARLSEALSGQPH